MNFLFYVFFFTIVDELASDEDEINEDDVQYIESLALKVRKGNCLFLIFITLNGVNNEIEHHLEIPVLYASETGLPHPRLNFSRSDVMFCLFIKQKEVELQVDCE